MDINQLETDAALICDLANRRGTEKEMRASERIKMAVMELAICLALTGPTCDTESADTTEPPDRFRELRDSVLCELGERASEVYNEEPFYMIPDWIWSQMSEEGQRRINGGNLFRCAAEQLAP